MEKVTLRILAEDVILLRNGGGFISDDDTLSEQQVMFWFATAIAEKYRNVLLEIRRTGTSIDRAWYSPVILTLTDADKTGPGRWWKVADLPTMMGIGDASPVIEEVTVDDYEPLRSTPNAFDRDAGRTYGRWGKDFGCFSSKGRQIRVSAPLEWDEPQTVEFMAVIIPDPATIITYADEPLNVPVEWLTEIRKSVASLAGITLSSAPDTVNNGTSGPADRQPITAP